MDQNIIEKLIDQGTSNPILTIVVIGLAIVGAAFLAFRKKKSLFQKRKEVISKTGKDQQIVDSVKDKIHKHQDK